jgi:hypothetical protein
MKCFEYGNPDANRVLIQMMDDHDLDLVVNEIKIIQDLAEEDFCFRAVKVDNWNDDLSPWQVPAVFGNEGFGGGAEHTLSEVLELTDDMTKWYYIGGYSLAGLFALWTSCKTDRFSGVAAASPSVWFPGFVDYMREHQVQTEAVYLSLGDKEEKTRNKVMSQVGGRIQECFGVLQEQNVRSTLEWNKGNHFKEPDVRTAKAFAWVLNNGGDIQ